MFPDDLKYTREHEWIRVEENIAVIGITQYAQQALGEVVFVDLPLVETVLDTGDILGVIESVKAISDIYSPCNGVIVEVNEKVISKPELINEDPYCEGWLVKMTYEEELEEFLSAKEYENYLK